VNARIRGPQVQDAVAIPRLALRDQGRVWVMSGKKLQIRKVEVVWAREETVLVRGDLRSGETVVTSRIAAPIEGMLLYTKEDQPNKPDEGQGGEEAS